MTTGERIKFFRLKRGLTQKQLAEKIGLTYSAISLIESDKRGLTLKRLRQISDALEVGLLDILEW